MVIFLRLFVNWAPEIYFLGVDLTTVLFQPSHKSYSYNCKMRCAVFLRRCNIKMYVAVNYVDP